MATKYTRKQAEAIGRAYAEIEAMAEGTDWAMPRRLRDALKYESRIRGSRTTARALMVNAFVDGYTRPYLCAAELYDISEGLAVAAMCGAHMARRKGAPSAAFLALADRSREAHQTALRAAMDKARAGIAQASED